METIASLWDHCPTEILCLIFAHLEYYSLLACMQVNTRWRKIARYITQKSGKWKFIVEDILEDKGLTFIEKSTLDWRDVYTNTILWGCVSEANIVLGRVYQESIIHQASRIRFANLWLQKCEEKSIIKDISVYKDILIVTDETESSYYHVAEKRSDLRKTEPNTNKSIARLENDHMVVTYEAPYTYDSQRICMYGKRCPDDKEPLKNTSAIVESVITYRLCGNRCYLIHDYWDVRFSVYVWNSKENTFTAIELGRYSRTMWGIADMQICKEQNGNDTFYVMLKCGKILRFQTNAPDNILEIAFKLKLPPHALRTNTIYAFHKFNAVVLSDEYKVTLHGKQDVMVFECPKLQCIADHGNVLIVGRVDGKVDIYLKKKLKMKNYIPERQIDLLDFKKNIKHLEILEIEVIESKRIHYLFIRTKDRVYQFNISHPKYNHLFEDEH